MKYLYHAIAILLIFAAFFAGRSCQPPAKVIAPYINLKPLAAKLATSKHNEDSLKVLVDSLKAVKTKVRHHWHKAKHDTSTPREVLINTCDSALAADSIHTHELEQLKAAKDSVICDLEQLQAAKDINHSIEVEVLESRVDSLKKEVRKHKWIKAGILTLWGIREGAGIVSRQQQP